MEKEENHSVASLPEDLIVVIGRQFGSGGRSLGKRIAGSLGLAYYDKELLNEAAREFGFSPEILAKADEKKPSPLSQFFLSSFGVHDSYGPETLSGEGLYKVQSRVIRKLGEKGGCVIVGRTADYILRDRPHIASIFLHAPLERRAEVLIGRGDAYDRRKAEDTARRADKRREEYYNYFTGRKWGTAANYDLTLDSSSVDDAALCEFICAYILRRFAREQ